MVYPVAYCEAGKEEGFWKLHSWRLVAYHSVLYLDSDVIITENIDHLFLRARSTEFSPGQAGAAPDVYDSEHFNAGVILLRPNMTAFARLAEASREYLRTAEKPDDQVRKADEGS